MRKLFLSFVILLLAGAANAQNSPINVSLQQILQVMQQQNGIQTATPLVTNTPTGSPTYTPTNTPTITNTPTQTFTPTVPYVVISTSGWNNANGVTQSFPGLIDGISVEQIWSSTTGVAGVSLNGYMGFNGAQAKTNPLIFPNAVPSTDKWNGLWFGTSAAQSGIAGSFGPANSIVIVPQATITPTFSPVVTIQIFYHLAPRISFKFERKENYWVLYRQERNWVGIGIWKAVKVFTNPDNYKG